MADAVDTPSIAYSEMSSRWSLLHDLLGGTEAMRAANTTWLPQEPKETTPQYDARLARSFLFNAYGDTITKLTSKPFSRPITLQGTLSERMETIEDDVDRTGRNLTQFGKDAFTAGVTYGLTHVFVDFPRGGLRTLEDERRLDARPVFVHVPPPSLIGWRSEKMESGKEELTQVRMHETATREDGEFSEKQVDRIRVWTRTDWQIWEKDADKSEYELVDEGAHTFGAIPLVTIYFARTGFLKADPPLEDLAWLNLAHWQSMSDQRNILRFARVGILFAAGFAEDEVEGGFAIGPNQLLHSRNEEAKLSYVEHNGQAIEAGQADLDRIEERMEQLGMQPLTQRSGDVTATGRAIDESKTHTLIQAWIRATENGVEEAYDVASRWTGDELPEDFGVNVFSDFAVSPKVNEEIKELREMRKADDLSRETYFDELKRRGFLSETVTVEEEESRLAKEGPGTNMFVPPTEDEDEEGDEEVDDELDDELDVAAAA